LSEPIMQLGFQNSEMADWMIGATLDVNGTIFIF